MVRIFKTIDGAIHEIQEPQEGCWIALTNPTATEIFEISEQFGIEVDDLRAPLDEEERSRIEVEDNYTLILADVPAIEERNEKDWHLHLKCVKCGKIIHLECHFMEEISHHIEESHGFTLQCKNSILYGVCKECKGSGEDC